VKKPKILLGDSWLDIIEIQEHLMNEHVLPIISYNPKNTDTLLDVKYRIEGLVRKRTDKVKLKRKELKKVYRKQSVVENTNNVLKQMRLEELRIDGWNVVKNHVYIILILSLAIAFERYCRDQSNHIRKISIRE
jgi:hypothetical protein